MTDIMKLADDYARAYMSFGEPAARAALQAAIEALQGENERLKTEAKTFKRSWLAFAEQMKDVAAERDALQAKLQRQEPVAWTEGPNAWKDWCGQWFGSDSDDSYLAKAVFELPPMAQKFRNAAPKALEPTILKPFTPCACHDETAKRYCKDKGKCSFFEAHGITKGTP